MINSSSGRLCVNYLPVLPDETFGCSQSILHKTEQELFDQQRIVFLELKSLKSLCVIYLFIALKPNLFFLNNLL